MIQIYIEQMVGFAVLASFCLTLLLYVQFKQKQNPQTRGLMLWSRMTVVAMALSTTIYTQSFLGRLQRLSQPQLQDVPSENLTHDVIDTTPLKINRDRSLRILS